MTSNGILVVGPNRYRLDAVLHLGNTGPEATFKTEELNTDVELIENQVTIEVRDPNHDPLKEEVVFYRQFGKYTLLLGKHRARLELAKRGEVKGRIISSPALKKAKIQ